MQSTASINGHPFHAMLVSFPVALFVTAFILDALYYLRGREPLWARCSYIILVMGVLWTALAEIPGLIDYLTMPMPGISTYHLVVGLIVLCLYATLVFFRRTGDAVGPPRIYLPLSALGVALISLQGYLGGELVYHYRVGVQPASSVSGAMSGPEKAAGGRTGAVKGQPVPLAALSALPPAQLATAESAYRSKCLGCHSLASIAGGDIGPNLSHEGRAHNKSWINDQILNPAKHTPGSGMPAFPDSALPPAQRDAIATLLASLK